MRQHNVTVPNDEDPLDHISMSKEYSLIFLDKFHERKYTPYNMDQVDNGMKLSLNPRRVCSITHDF